MASVALRSVTKKLPGRTFALDDLSLDVPDGVPDPGRPVRLRGDRHCG
jgi:hypothetical protein